MKHAARGLVPFAYGFRPFFLLAGIHAVVAIAVWTWLHGLGAAPLPALPPQYWHAHEMLYGFIAATIAGFMLTAVPSWTGNRGFAGGPLVALVLLWLAGRLGFFVVDFLPARVLAVAELAFIPALVLTLAPSLLRQFNRNSPLLLVLLLFWAGDVVFMTGLLNGDALMAGRGLRIGMDLVLVLLTVIGGRIVPAFTGNALRAHGVDIRLRSYVPLDRITIALMLAYAVADIVSATHAWTGALAGLAAMAQACRLAGWHGWRTGGQPIVWVLHVAYLWLPLGLALKAASVLGGFAWAAHWPHALGMGAAGTMILAVMTRAALGHTGRALAVAPPVTVAYVLLTLAVTLRVFGPAFLALPYATLIAVAAALWVVTFLLYLAVYTPILLLPRADGKAG